ncbi:MAG TPA: hypothetical protein VF668_19705 [Pyrinomonadaceae bacterium]
MVRFGEETKTCSKCGRRLPLTAFYALRRGLLGRRPDCKACHNAYRNGWARRRYVPKTGRRYVTKADRAARAAQEGA